jgi:hypothetical protein
MPAQEQPDYTGFVNKRDNLALAGAVTRPQDAAADPRFEIADHILEMPLVRPKRRRWTPLSVIPIFP